MNVRKDDLGFGISESSSGSENDYKDDEKYSPDNLMRPMSMSRPLRLTNDQACAVPGTSGSAPPVEEKSEVEKVLIGHMEFISETMEVLHIGSLQNKFSIAFVEALDGFRVKLAKFEETLQDMNSKEVQRSFTSSERANTFETSILKVNIQLANFYAFIVFEYLKVLTHAKRSKQPKSIINKIRGLIQNIGTIDEIAVKIHFRSIKSPDDSNIGSKLVPARITNELIIKQLKKSLKKKKKAKKLCSIKRFHSIEICEDFFNALTLESVKEKKSSKTAEKTKSENIPEEPSSVSKKSKKSKKKSKSAKNEAKKNEVTGGIEKTEDSITTKTESIESDALKISKYYSNYNLSSIIFSQLSEYEMEFDDAEIKEELPTQSMDTEKNQHIEKSSIMKFIDFSIIKIIILLNTLQFGIKTFEIKHSVAALESLKDCLKILHHIIKFSDMLQKEFSSNKDVEIEEYFLPTSKMCQSHLYAVILSQSADFIRSATLQSNDNEAKIYSEFLPLVEVFGTVEEMKHKLRYRNDDIYTELAKQVSAVTPLSCIYTSNEDIVENVTTSIGKSEKDVITEETQVTIHYLKLPSAFGPTKCTEFDYLHINIEQLQKLLELQYIIYSCDWNPFRFRFESEDMKEFCESLRIFEEFKERELKIGTFVHSFLNTMDNILSHHVLRILVSQFYSFIFHMLLDHYSRSHKLDSKTDAKSYRRILLDLVTYLCPIYKIPEKLCFRNDKFFKKFTREIFGVQGLVINYSSEQLCANISRMLRENKIYLDSFHKKYISKPTSFKKQIAILERKFFFNDQIFYIRIHENGEDKSVHFKELANKVMQSKLS